jgi:hypothetical protein
LFQVAGQRYATALERFVDLLDEHRKAR